MMRPPRSGRRACITADVDNYNTSANDDATWLEIDHVQLAMPAGGEDDGSGVLLRRCSGIPEVPKPPSAGRPRRLLVRGRRGARPPRRRRGLPSGPQGPPGARRARPAPAVERARPGGHMGRRHPRRRAGPRRPIRSATASSSIERPDCAGSATRRSPTSCAAAGRRPRRGRCCRARPSCRREFGASRVTVVGRWSCCATRADRRPPGLRVVRRHRAGAPAAGAPRHDRGPARAAGGAAPSARSSEFAFVDAARARPRRSARRRRSGPARRARQPGRRRAVRHRHGVVPCRAGPARCRATTSSATRSTSCSASRYAARPRPSAPTLRRRPRRQLLHVPVGAPMLRCRRVTTDTSGRPVL